VSDDQLMKMMKRLKSAIEDSQSFAHVMIENGVVPGVTSSCRCDDCRHTARRMAEAEYLDDVKDRWWEKDEGG
jgi:hypothetical protein